MRHRHVAPAVVLLTLVFAGAVVAQQGPPRLTNATIIKDTPLEGEEQKACRDYVDYWIKQMATGKPDAVTAARDRLTEPYSQGAKDFFLSVYNQAVANGLATIVESEHLITRINVQIVAKPVKHVKIAEVIRKGLADESPAVVYPAAQSAASLMEDQATPLALRLQMVKPLVTALQKQDSGWILEYLYVAAVNTNEEEAINASLKKMCVRAGVHAARKDGKVGAEISGLKAAVLKLTRIKLDAELEGANKKKLSVETLKLFGQALFLLADHATNVLVAGNLSSTAEASYQSLIQGLDESFEWLVSRGLEKQPPKRLRGQNAAGQRLTVLADWKPILKAEPLKLTDEELTIPKPESTTTPASAKGD